MVVILQTSLAKRRELCVLTSNLPCFNFAGVAVFARMALVLKSLFSHSLSADSLYLLSIHYSILDSHLLLDSVDSTRQGRVGVKRRPCFHIVMDNAGTLHLGALDNTADFVGPASAAFVTQTLCPVTVHAATAALLPLCVEAAAEPIGFSS